MFRKVSNHYKSRNRFGEFNREQVDYAISRYGCYILAQNGDPRKPAIARAQAYFALQTRKQEQFEELDADRQRLLLRGEVVDNNKRLNAAAKQHGVFNYGAFHNAGYKGLYGGLGLGQIEKRKKLGKDKLLDRADTTELAANLFRITQTEDVLANDALSGGKQGQRGAESTHQQIGARVRQTIIDNRSTLPENLAPASEHITQVKKRLNS